MNGLPVRYAVNIETRCWEWCGEINRKGYGRLWVGGKRRFAHRAYYEAKYGPIPEGLQIDHLCRNRSCVNPDHLEPVTALENRRRGNSITKLSPAAVREIRASGETQTALAKRFGVSQSTISEARRGITWSGRPGAYAERKAAA